MKRTGIILILAVMLMSTGCDFMRKLAGRPASGEIEAKKGEIVRYEASVKEQARQDSIRAAYEDSVRLAEIAIRDSVAACEYFRNECTIHNVDRFGGLASAELEHRYYVVVGSFRQRSNAERFMEKINSYGDFSPVMATFRNGMIAVGVCPRNKVRDLEPAYKDVREMDFCPSEAWILINE